MCIEYDGMQHYKSIEHFGGSAALEIIQLHDLIKDEYCGEYNIPLLRIKYDQSDNGVKQLINFINCYNCN